MISTKIKAGSRKLKKLTDESDNDAYDTDLVIAEKKPRVNASLSCS